MSDEAATLILAKLDRLTELVTPLLERAGRTIPDHPMSPAEVGAVLGKHEKTVRRWIGLGKLRAKRTGHTLTIRPVDLHRFLEA